MFAGCFAGASYFVLFSPPLIFNCLLWTRVSNKRIYMCITIDLIFIHLIPIPSNTTIRSSLSLRVCWADIAVRRLALHKALQSRGYTAKQQNWTCPLRVWTEATNIASYICFIFTTCVEFSSVHTFHLRNYLMNFDKIWNWRSTLNVERSYCSSYLFSMTHTLSEAQIEIYRFSPNQLSNKNFRNIVDCGLLDCNAL